MKLTETDAEESGVNTRTYHLEDAARLAMGSFALEDRVEASWRVRGYLRYAIVATAISLALIAALAYLA